MAVHEEYKEEEARRKEREKRTKAIRARRAAREEVVRRRVTAVRSAVWETKLRERAATLLQSYARSRTARMELKHRKPTPPTKCL